MEFDELLAGLDVSSGVAAIMGAGVLLIMVGFVLWLTDTIATWFNSHDDSDEEEDSTDPAVIDTDDGVECTHCGWAMDNDDDGPNWSYCEGMECPKCGEY